MMKKVAVDLERGDQIGSPDDGSSRTGAATGSGAELTSASWPASVRA
jgi:hypothetical protein